MNESDRLQYVHDQTAASAVQMATLRTSCQAVTVVFTSLLGSHYGHADLRLLFGSALVSWPASQSPLVGEWPVTGVPHSRLEWAIGIGIGIIAAILAVSIERLLMSLQAYL